MMSTVPKTKRQTKSAEASQAENQKPKDHKPKAQKKSHLVLRTILWVILSSFGILLLLSFIWEKRHFADINMDEIIFQLTSPSEGTGAGLVENFLLTSLLPSIIFAIAEIFIAVFQRKKPWYRKLTISGAFSGAGLSILLLIIFSAQIGFFSYVSGILIDTDFYEKNYVDPSTVSITFPEEKRNLIYIYMESMETSFADFDDGGASENDYIPELVTLAKENEDFSGSGGEIGGGYAFPGSTWTMAGIVSTAAGLPLYTSIDDNEMASQKAFFPNLTTLGDILHDEGYKQVFQCGSDVTFGGRRLWFSDHGGYELFDLVQAKKDGLIPEDYNVFWGYEDEKLFAFAKNKLLSLAEAGKPFNYTILTVDTHAADGYLCDDCPDEYDSQYENVIACSSKRVYDFVRWVQKQDFYKNTTIVITGDHPSMDPSIKCRLDQSYVRRVYTCYINSAVSLRRSQTNNANSAHMMISRRRLLHLAQR